MDDFLDNYKKKFDIPTTKTVKLTEAEQFLIGFTQLLKEITPKAYNYVEKINKEIYIKSFVFEDGSKISLIDLLNGTQIYNKI